MHLHLFDRESWGQERCQLQLEAGLPWLQPMLPHKARFATTPARSLGRRRSPNRARAAGGFTPLFQISVGPRQFDHHSVNSVPSYGVALRPLSPQHPRMSRKLLTLVIPRQCGKLLLGKKLRGFGEGYVNGFGGKVEPWETIEESAVRELREEAGITATAMHKCGVLTFVFDDKPVPWEVHVFDVTAWEGEPAASDEMDPIWFLPEHIPFDKMWADDIYWYPLFLAGHKFRGTFHFQDTHTLVEHHLQKVSTL